MLAACLPSSREKLTIGSSIANIYARGSFTAQRAMVSLNTLYGGQFILCLGVGHIPMVEGVCGHRYEKPLALSDAKSRGAVPYNVTP
ncbi:LLM class flavin-dependent oxidoreductase [Bradyrhizobium lablabi]|nr:LLM class flavin-dependent oxidoreductase [Bradyrhizobium lablabi]